MFGGRRKIAFAIVIMLMLSILAYADAPIIKEDKYRKNIRVLDKEIWEIADKLFELKVRSFEWKSNNETDFGLIPEEVAQLLPEIVTFDDNGEPIGINIGRLLIFMLIEMQKMRGELDWIEQTIFGGNVTANMTLAQENITEIEELKEQVENLTETVKALEEKVEELEKILSLYNQTSGYNKEEPIGVGNRVRKINQIVQTNVTKLRSRISDNSEKQVGIISGYYKTKDVAFPGDVLVIKLNFKPKRAMIITPLNETIPIIFKKNGDKYVFTTTLQKNVVLGEYKLVVDDIVKTFYIDYWEMTAEFKENKGIVGKVDYFYISPKEVEYYIDGKYAGKVKVRTGKFEITKLKPGKHKVTIKAGNAEFTLEYEL